MEYKISKFIMLQRRAVRQFVLEGKRLTSSESCISPLSPPWDKPLPIRRVLCCLL